MEKKEQNKEETIEMFYKRFGETLRHYRKKKRISQEKLAEDVGVSTTIISEYERGEKIPNILNASKLATILEVSLDELCFEHPKVRYQNELKEEILFIFLSALSLYEIRFDMSDKDKILLSMPKNSGKYNRREMIELLKEYEIVQSYLTTESDANDVEKKREERFLKLQNKYHYLPELPAYTFPSKEDESSSKENKKTDERK